MKDHDRTPPYDERAEMAVLGGMLMRPAVIEEISALLAGGSFYPLRHQYIYDAIITLDGRGQGADAVTVARELERRGELTRIGGPAYLHELMQSVPTAANAGYHAEIVREHHIRRRLIEIGTQLVQMGYDTTDHTDIPTMIDRAQSLTMSLEHDDPDEEDLSIGGAYFETLDSIEHGISDGIPTGLRDYDALTGGLHPGQMVIVAGRPAHGKSVIGENWARHAAIECGKPAAIFSLEMSRGELAKRAISAEGAIPLHHLAPGKMEDRDWERVAQRAAAKIPDAPLYIDQTANQTINTVRSKARRMKRRYGIELLVVDYLQLMEAEETKRGGENRQQQVSAISRGLKLLAKELQISVVAVAQLNRGPEDRADKKPQISDLRESGSLEQDADVVVLIHREAAYGGESPRAGEADLLIAKHRGGPTATLTVTFQGHYARFRDMGQG